jgi:hydroxymethylglutaryl-CoA lyase
MHVNMIEVGPRDGFQSVKEFIPTETKIKIVEGIIASGIKKIQLSSFVSPKAIPQMQDAKDVFQYFLEKYKDSDLEIFALVPNFRGAENAYNAGAREVSYVISVSEAHNKANVNKTLDESFAELEKIIQAYPDLKICLDVATAFGCPFDGEVSLSSVMEYLERGYNLGIRTFNICDTIGIANPAQVEATIKKVVESFKDCTFHIHIHDTRNMGVVNSLTGIQNGIINIQTALGGLGGCPFAPGASGNTSTEDMVYMLEKMGVSTGVDFEKLLSTAKYQKEVVKGNFSGHHININKVGCNA